MKSSCAIYKELKPITYPLPMPPTLEECHALPIEDPRLLTNQQKPLVMFHQFVLLPPEVRLKVWDESLENETESRFLLYYGMGHFWAGLPTHADDRSLIFPHKGLRSSLCKYYSIFPWL